MEIMNKKISDYKYKYFTDYVKKKKLGEIFLNVSLKNYCTLHIGGTAYCVYKPNSLKNLQLAYIYIIKNNLDFFILGNGSNLLINDKYHLKVFINLKNLNNTFLDKNILECEAGINAMILSKNTSRLGLSGLEFLAGIPGSMGGIIYMNAGAWNNQISDVLESVTYLDEFGYLCEMKDIKNKGFKYRVSPFQKRKVIIVGCKIKLQSENINYIPFELYKQNLYKKKQTQPINVYSAGCAFKNHDNFKAWQLIESTGCHNLQINDAAISEVHHNFLINKGNATFNDMYTLLNLIKEEVYEKYLITLETEWCILK